jgi:exonuclease VII large subunit
MTTPTPAFNFTAGRATGTGTGTGTAAAPAAGAGAARTAFNFAAGTGTGTGAGTGTFSFGAKAAAPEQPVEVPEELKNRTVKQVLDDFEKQLEQQASKFEQQARRIARWDRAIYDCMALIRHLEEQINAVDGAQKELQQNTKHLLDDQEDFLKRLRERTSARPPPGSDQRQRLYALAHSLGERFLDMENKLREIVERTSGERHMESATDIEKVEMIANCHLGSMRWLMDQANELEDKIKALEEQVGAAG